MTVTTTFSAPYDWQPGDTISQARINAMQSNIMFLQTPTQDRLQQQVTTNTTSTSFADIALATFTKTTNARAVEIGFLGSVNISTAATAVMTLLVDGVNVGDGTQGLHHVPATAATNSGVCMVFRTAALTAASHTVKVQWKTSTGTLTLLAGWHMWIVER